MGKALTQEEVVDRFVELHGRRYNYSSVNYINNRTELEIICEKHGTTFFMTSRTHLKGGKCDQCALEDREERFINKAKNVHGNEYNYSSVRYVESKIKVDVICEKHGTFSVIPKNHLQGVGCDSCSLEASAKKRTYTTEEFIRRARIIHGDLYDYSCSIYVKGTIPIKIRCKKHGIFERTPESHLQGRGCNDCTNEAMSGKGNPSYIHGKSKERRAKRHKERNNPENTQWKKAVKEGKTECDTCNESFTPWNISCAHHLNSWVDHIDERYDVNNGVAICWECHEDFHNAYGWGYNFREQYYQFKQLKELELCQ